jgi:hypothetical protein
MKKRVIPKRDNAFFYPPAAAGSKKAGYPPNLLPLLIVYMAEYSKNTQRSDPYLQVIR